MEMDARSERRETTWKGFGNNGMDAIYPDIYSDEQLYERIGQAKMRIEDEGLILEACRQILRQRGLSIE